MPLIILSGYPCSGKTYRAKQIVDAFTRKIETSTFPAIKKLKVHHVDDGALGVSRASYGNARDEKKARAEGYSAVKRVLGKDTIVIADGLNYIKGFRYQLYCEAKAVHSTSCVTYVGTSKDRCRAIHSSRQSSDPSSCYPSEDFENLLFRYEEPNGMSRWDSPLFTVVYDDPDPPYDAIWEALIGSEGQAHKNVRPNAATILKPAKEEGYLFELEKITKGTSETVSSWIADHADQAAGGEIRVGGGEGEEQALVVRLPMTTVTPAQLQRVRRAFVGLNRHHEIERGRIRSSFVDYVNDAFGTADG